MDTRRVACILAGLGLAALAPACGDASGDAGFGGDESPTTAGGSGGPGEGGTGTGDAGMEPPSEMEDEGDFRVPRASGRFVYSASESSDSVAVIDSSTLAIDVVGVGRGPTVVAPLSTEGPVAVLDQGSDDVALLRTDDAGATTVEIIPSSPGANNLAVSEDGEYVFVYHDVDGPEELGPGSDQELTVIEIPTGQAYEMTVGAHPRDVVFDSAGSVAYMVTDDGVNVIPTADLAMIGKPDLIPVTDDPAIDPARLEIHVAADQGAALARIDGDPRLFATDLATGEQFTFDLPGAATDLDIARDSSFAIVTLPSLTGSRFIEVPLPVTAATELLEFPVDGEYVGLAHLSPEGSTMLLYTTVDPRSSQHPGLPDPHGPAFGGSAGSSGSSGSSEGSGSSGDGDPETGDEPPLDEDPRQRVTIMRRGDGDWAEQLTLFVDHPVVSVGMAPDGANAMLVHGEDPELPATPYSYTLLDLSKQFPVKKLQVVEAEPGPILFTPDGDRSVVLLRDDPSDVRRVDLVDLRSFIVDGLSLGSPPEGAGHVEATDKIFVSQEHPTGRITFLDRDSNVETVTGYRLNDAVKD